MPLWAYFTPLPTVLCLAILLSGVRHSLGHGRKELGVLRATTIALSGVAFVLGYGPGAWLGPAAILSWFVVIVAGARQYAWLHKLEQDSR